jgi:predicted histidine transporter YuiF (NhaC family)
MRSLCDYFAPGSTSPSVSRDGQKLVLPIAITEQPSWQQILTAVAIPSVVMLVAQLLLVGPANRRAKRLKVEERRELNRSWVQKQKQEADTQLELLKRSVSRKRKEEERRGGLIIVEAAYGNLDQEYSEGEEKSLQIDISIALQMHVNQSRLELSSGPKSAFVGAYDPCPGENKKLCITYMYKVGVVVCVCVCISMGVRQCVGLIACIYVIAHAWM